MPTGLIIDRTLGRKATRIPIDRSLVEDQQRRLAAVKKVLFLIDCWAAGGELDIRAHRIEHLMHMANRVLAQVVAVYDAGIFIADVDANITRAEAVVF